LERPVGTFILEPFIPPHRTAPTSQSLASPHIFAARTSLLTVMATLAMVPLVHPSG
jgi:hypothetical protein